jgi:hypothetical protein
MWPHFANLIHLVWSAWLSQMSSSTPAQVFTGSVFVLTQIFKSLRNLKENGRFSLGKLKQFWIEHWRDNIRDGVVAIAVVALLNGAWLTVRIVYDDHHKLADQNALLIEENRSLKASMGLKPHIVTAQEQEIQERKRRGRLADSIEPFVKEGNKLYDWMEKEKPDLTIATQKADGWYARSKSFLSRNDPVELTGFETISPPVPSGAFDVFPQGMSPGLVSVWRELSYRKGYLAKIASDLRKPPDYVDASSDPTLRGDTYKLALDLCAFTAKYTQARQYVLGTIGRPGGEQQQRYLQEVEQGYEPLLVRLIAIVARYNKLGISSGELGALVDTPNSRTFSDNYAADLKGMADHLFMPDQQRQ